MSDFIDDLISTLSDDERRFYASGAYKDFTVTFLPRDPSEGPVAQEASAFAAYVADRIAERLADRDAGGSDNGQ